MYLTQSGHEVIRKQSDEWIKQFGVVPIAGCAITDAGALLNRYFVHVATPMFVPVDPQQSERQTMDHLRTCMFNILECASELASTGCKSLSLPPMVIGEFGLRLDVSAKIMLNNIVNWCAGNENCSLKRITLVCFKDEELAAYHKYFTDNYLNKEGK